MNCRRCGGKLKQGHAYFSSRSYDFDLLNPAPEILFCVGETEADTLNVRQQEGMYCPECGTFTMTFNIKKHAVFEDGFDMELDENIDCLPQKSCPQCGADVDIDYPKCPECGSDFQ